MFSIFYVFLNNADANHVKPKFIVCLSTFHIMVVTQEGLNVQNVVIILYKIWYKSWFVSGDRKSVV